MLNYWFGISLSSNNKSWQSKGWWMGNYIFKTKSRFIKAKAAWAGNGIGGLLR